MVVSTWSTEKAKYKRAALGRIDLVSTLQKKFDDLVLGDVDR